MKTALFLLLGASVAMNIYLVNVEVVVKDELDQEAPETYQSSVDSISIAQAAPQKQECETKVVEKIVEKIVYKKSAHREEPLPEKVDRLGKEETERLVSEYRNEWKKKSQEFFDYRLGLSASQQEEYHSLKEMMEKEISQMLKNEAGVKEGEGHMLTSQEMVKMGSIHEKYEGRLKAAFGDQAYNEYIRFKDDYNKKLTQNGHGFFGIGF